MAPFAPPSTIFARHALTAIGYLRAGMLNAVLPPRCLACGSLVETPSALCAACWSKLQFVSEPMCVRCGHPFEVALEGEVCCAACLAVEPKFQRARSAIAYDDGSRSLILGFKHGDRLDAAKAFAPWMARAGRELLTEADLLVPVPLHWTRLFVRRYNQANVLAQAVGRLAGRRVAPDLLVRRRRTKSLGTFGPRQRAATVRGAFVVAERWRTALPGKRIVLVDDVLTTGATVGACIRALKRAGVAGVDVLTLARVVRPATVNV